MKVETFFAVGLVVAAYLVVLLVALWSNSAQCRPGLLAIEERVNLLTLEVTTYCVEGETVK